MGNRLGECRRFGKAHALSPLFNAAVAERKPLADAPHNGVDHNLSSQSSAINFVEYNWRLPAIAGSFDQAFANIDREEHIPFDLAGMFDFEAGEENSRLTLDPTTGEPLRR